MKLESYSRRSVLYFASTVALAVLSLCGFSAQAHAACGVVDDVKHQAAELPPMFAPDDAASYKPTVIGLWHAIYTNSADQSMFNDSFKSWHSDGTEIESAFLSPAGGNVCMGVWKQTGSRTFKLHHTGWLYNTNTPAATATNYFTVDEWITVAADGKTYHGSFIFQVWTLAGKSTPLQVKGTIAAWRLTV